MHRRTGKIARLPKDLRDLVNHMVDDGAQYTSIINALEKQRHRWPSEITEITENNVSTWKLGGYRDWVRDQELAADLNARNEFAASVLQGAADEDKLHEAVVQVGIAQLHHVLASFNRDEAEAELARDPRAYARLINSSFGSPPAPSNFRNSRTSSVNANASSSHSSSKPIAKAASGPKPSRKSKRNSDSYEPNLSQPQLF